jgi:hypothetical protein
VAFATRRRPLWESTLGPLGRGFFFFKF